jgi:cell division septation protein DedD
MRSLFIGCAVIAAVIAMPAAADTEAGVKAWLAGDYPNAVAEWRGPAAAGEPDAQFNLGQAYKLGRGVPADAATALGWYRKAAAAGHEQAQATLGLQLFQSGQREEAMIWLKKAADQGEPRAQYVVGTAYFNGDSLPRDWARAYALMTRAKASGIGAATTSLAQMEQLIPEQQRLAGLALAREMERTATLRASDTPGPGAPLTLRTERTPQPVGQTSIPASAPPAAAAPAPIAAAQTSNRPWKAPIAAPPAKAAGVTAVTAKPVARPAAPIVAAAGGGWKVQLGAFSSPDGAKGAWSTLSGKAPVISPGCRRARSVLAPLPTRLAPQSRRPGQLVSQWPPDRRRL